MEKIIKKFVKSTIEKVMSALISVLSMSNIGRFIINENVKSIMRIRKEVRHQGCSLSFVSPNMLNYFRADTFSTKEPETLEWLDSIAEGSVIWDVGANVGLYSCYAAIQRKCKVFAFEPSVFNLELLARNIYNNGLVDKVTIVPLSLSDELKISTLNMTTTDWGGALSSFGEEYGYDGNKLNKLFEFSTVGVSMDDAVELLKLPMPKYIKMDVDGIEHLILKGGKRILDGVEGILVEVNENFTKQSEITNQCLSEAGLSLLKKRHSDMFEGHEKFGSTYNQIWHRK